MKHIISFSGGIGSFVCAKRVVDKYGKDNCILVFCDTLIEDDDLYRFVDDAVNYLDCEYVYLSKGETPWDVFRRKKYMGNSRVAHCSVELKSKPFKEWLESNYSPSECIIYFGFDWTEEHRLPKVRKNYKNYTCEAILTEPPLLERGDMFKIVEECGIEIPKLYKDGFLHNYCGGFCVKAGQAHFKNLYNVNPERYKYHEKKQNELFEDYPQTNRPFIRMTINGKLNYLSLTDFRKFLENGNSIDEYEYGGCGCFSDEIDD